jgi:signal transduction histidine kinase
MKNTDFSARALSIFSILLFLCPLVLFFLPEPSKIHAITSHALVTEICLVLIALFNLKKNSTWKALLSFFSLLLIADLLDNIDLWIPLSEVLFSLSFGSLVLALWSIRKSFLSQTKDLLWVFAFATPYAIAVLLFVLIPYFTSTDNPPLLFQYYTSSFYSFCCILVFGAACAGAIRSNSLRETLFFQSLLFLLISDLVLIYHQTLSTPVPWSISELGWNFGISGILLAFSLQSRREDLFQTQNFVQSFLSVRCLLTLVVSLASVLLVAGVYISNLIEVSDVYRLSSTLILIYVVWVTSNVIAWKVSSDLSQIKHLMRNQETQKESSGNLVSQKPLEKINEKTFLAELDSLISSYNNLIDQNNVYLKSLVEQTQTASMGRLAAQVAHDIRSPLAAIQGIERELPQLPESQRLLLRSAIGRIRDIANNLILKNREVHLQKQSEAVTLKTYLITSLVDSLVTEKRMQFRSHLNIEIDWNIAPGTQNLYAKVNPTEFKTALSNIINNGIEAMSFNGHLSLEIHSTQSEVHIEVKDTGIGIPENIMSHLGTRGFTYGKDEGSGLGLYQAKESLKAWGGRIAFDSDGATGTTVTIQLPRSSAPSWFATTLPVQENSRVVILDDDPSIHQIWINRFGSLQATEKGVELFHCSTPQELRAFVSGQKANQINQRVQYLVDFELIGYKETGTMLIEELQIENQSILVTSHFDEDPVLHEVKRLGIRIIPKSTASFIEIIIKK